MEKIKMLKILLMIILFNGFIRTSNACEKHRNLEVKTTELPSGSLYHLSSQWSDQESRVLQLSELAGRSRLIAMVYTKCRTACPLLVQDIKSMMLKVSKEHAKDLHVDLFSFDSEGESSKSLQAFKEKFKLNENWSIYSGSKNSVSELAAALGVQYKKLPSGEYIHSNVIFFVNEKGEVVAKHEGLGREASNFVKKIENAL